jgi:hypothetical protein
MLDYRVAAMNARLNPSRSSAPKRRAWVYPLAIAAILAVPATADAAHVKGRFEGFRSLQNPVWAEAKDPKNHGYSFREPVPTVRAEYRRPFPHIPKELCLAALAASPQKPPPPILIRVGGGRTTPVTIVVAPGTRLTFQNTDPFKHRIYGVGLKTFAASDTLQGATRDWSVPEPGTYEIRDEAAPSLRMWIVAEPAVAAIAYPSMKGDFSIAIPEPGDYTLQAYFAGKKVGAAVPVTIKAEGQELDISKTAIKVSDEKAPPPAAAEAPPPVPAPDDKSKEGAK